MKYYLIGKATRLRFSVAMITITCQTASSAAKMARDQMVHNRVFVMTMAMATLRESGYLQRLPLVDVSVVIPVHYIIFK